MGLSRAEQETVIRWDEDQRVVHVYSASPKTWRKMARLGLEPDRVSTTKGSPSGKFWTIASALFRWGLKRKGGGKGNPAALAQARAARSGL